MSTPSLAAAAHAQLRRDLRLVWRRRGDALQPVLFAVMVISLFPLALGAEPALLGRVAPAVLWIAILLAGAAGLHIGRSMAFPGERPLAQAAAEAGRRGALVMTGVVLMLVAAALLEGFARQLVDNTAGRFTIGGFMLVFWLVYFYALRPARRHEARP